MRSTKGFGAACLVLVLLTSAALSQVGAQGMATGPFSGATSSSYRLDWRAASAGGSAAGGPYMLEFAVGRSDAGVLCSDRYTMIGGLWGAEGQAVGFAVYLPVIVRH